MAYTNITGSDTDHAKSLLEACNGNMDLAIGMAMDQNGKDDGASAACGLANIF